MNTLERKKIKEDKYEFFLADKDGNFSKKFLLHKFFNTLKIVSKDL